MAGALARKGGCPASVEINRQAARILSKQVFWRKAEGQVHVTLGVCSRKGILQWYIVALENVQLPLRLKQGQHTSLSTQPAAKVSRPGEMAAQAKRCLGLTSRAMGPLFCRAKSQKKMPVVVQQAKL